MLNIIKDNSVLNDGGGITCYFSTPVIINNIISGNAVEGPGFGCGGGIYFYKSNLALIGNTFVGNVASRSGGGILIDESSPVIVNNILCGNSAISESGGGIRCYYSIAKATNLILWDNHAPVGPEIYIDDPNKTSTFTITYSDVKGGLSSVFVSIASSVL